MIRLSPFRLAVLSNSTIDLIVPALVASAARHGIALEVIQPSYDQVAQEALTPDSRVNSSKPDAVLFALDYRALPLKLSPGDCEASSATVQGAIGYLQALRNGIKANSNAVCIFQTFAPPVETLFGSLDRALPGTLRSLHRRHQPRVGRVCVLGSGDVLLDVAGLRRRWVLPSGTTRSFGTWPSFHFPTNSFRCMPIMLPALLPPFAARARKVLILDLDNTVWGGVIGDDGLEGSRLRRATRSGEAHLAVQRLALDLRQRGIVLAVCSKNTDEVAREPFEKHPEMLLKLDHIAVFQANWNDKATNIQAIAEELSLGPGRDGLSGRQPGGAGAGAQAASAGRRAGAAGRSGLLCKNACGGADTLRLLPLPGEDLKRAGFYQDNAKRASLQKQVGGVDAYLASLDMTITFQPFDATGRARIVQLINKSNQYNLTTRRYTEPEMTEAENDPEVFTLQVRLADIFGDNGMISVVICRPGEAGVWEIDTWLMSCRVLGRKVEHMVLREILEHARAAGIAEAYRHLPAHGSQQARRRSLCQARLYQGRGRCVRVDALGIACRGAEPESAPMKVISQGFVPATERSTA